MGAKEEHPAADRESRATDYAHMIAHAVDEVGQAMMEISNLPTSFEDRSPEGASDELDWDLFDIGDVNHGSPNSTKQRLAAVKQRLQDITERLMNPQRIMLRDTMAFSLGSCQLWSIAYWLGWSPSTFYKLYTGQVVVLMCIRWGWYRHKRWHYYLLDFCYFANLLLLLHLWVAPRSMLLNKVTYAFNTGPLTWSVIAFRNSLVYHDLDKVTSVFLHLVPACVTWTLRWHPDTSRFGPAQDATQAAQAAWQNASLVQLVVLPLLPYITWAVVYYFKIFVWSAERIRQRGYMTLFSYVTTTTKGVYAAIARRVPRQYRPQVYLFLHMCFCATTFMVSWLCWRSFFLHTLLLACMGAVSVWHGATYYFDVFAKRYLSELQAVATGKGAKT